MTIEALPLGREQEAAKENPLSRVAQTIKDWAIENLTYRRRNRRLDLIAGYLGIVLVHEVAKSHLTKEEAMQRIDEFASAGLPADQMLTTYEYIEGYRMYMDWIDINFQLETLERFFPEVLERAKNTK